MTCLSRYGLLLLLLAGLSACEYVRPTLNAPLAHWDPQYGYRMPNLTTPEQGNSDSLLIVAAFSGGGTRASTLAFGALRELARQPITWEGKQKRLLDELDVIYALSGGTFTGAYYALFGERIFHDFEYRFLRKDWESELRARIFRSPSNWFRLWSPYFGRTHIMAELLDEALFEGKTYGDLLQQRTRPGILIHASDMATLSRFEFLQAQFDAMCSDLNQLPVAYASAASAALPLVLSPITFKNYAGQCGYEPPQWLVEAKKSTRPIQRQRAQELLSYLDPEKRPHIHLLDGGLSDNMALRGIVEGVGVSGGLENVLKRAGVKNVQKLVIISVNAETAPDVKEYRSDHIPVFSRAFSSLVDIPINRYSTDTLLLMRFAVQLWRNELRIRPPDAETAFTKDAEIYFIDVSLNAVEDLAERESLMNIPTTLRLTDQQIDRLIMASTRLIRNDPEFQRLMKDLEVSP
ncbi:MAG TPA: patatin-like phospholipase family protein [Nitrospiraceae bacterium]|nr:patatin-like phospholipase family protein [Nitrospiraceae bacterium]